MTGSGLGPGPAVEGGARPPEMKNGTTKGIEMSAHPKGLRVALDTLGCRMNQSETAAMIDGRTSRFFMAQSRSFPKI